MNQVGLCFREICKYVFRSRLSCEFSTHDFKSTHFRSSLVHDSVSRKGGDGKAVKAVKSIPQDFIGNIHSTPLFSRGCSRIKNQNSTLLASSFYCLYRSHVVPGLWDV